MVSHRDNISCRLDWMSSNRWSTLFLSLEAWWKILPPAAAAAAAAAAEERNDGISRKIKINVLMTPFVHSIMLLHANRGLSSAINPITRRRNN